MDAEKKIIVGHMPETDQQAWLRIRKDNQENAEICLAELAPEAVIMMAEENMMWAQYDRDHRLADQWREKRKEFLMVVESLREFPLRLDEMRFNFRDALARTLIDSMMNRLEKQMNQSKRQLLPCALMEHARKTGAPDYARGHRFPASRTAGQVPGNS